MTGSTAAHGTTSSLLEWQHGTTAWTGEAIAGANVSRMFCITFLSGIIWVLQSKYLPTGDMIAGDLRLELTLAKANTGVKAAGTVLKYMVSEVELMLEYTDLASDAAPWRVSPTPEDTRSPSSRSRYSLHHNRREQRVWTSLF